MSYFFSSLRSSPLLSTPMALSRDNEDQESDGTLILEGDDDQRDAYPSLMDEHFASSFDMNGNTQALKSLLSLDEAYLSQNDSKGIDERCEIQDSTNIESTEDIGSHVISLGVPISLSYEDTTTSKNLPLPPTAFKPEEPCDFSQDEVFQAIGCYLLRQSLQSDLTHGDDDVKEVVFDQEDNRFSMKTQLMASRIQRLFWSLLFEVRTGTGRGIGWIVSLTSYMAWFVIFLIIHPVSSLTKWILKIVLLLFHDVNIHLYAEDVSAATLNMAFWRGATAMVILGASLVLVRRDTLSAVDMLFNSLSDVIDRIRAIIIRVRMIYSLPKLEIEDRTVDPLSSSESIMEEESMSLDSHVVELFNRKTTSYYNNPSFIEAADYSNVESHQSYHLSSHVFSGNESWTSGAVVWKQEVHGNSAFDPMHLTAGLSLGSLVVLACFYTWLSRYRSSRGLEISAKSESDFVCLRGARLDAECLKKGLRRPVLRQDKLRYLCQHEGIDHLFPRRNLLNYSHLTKIELKLALKDLGQYTSGNKEDLQYRLLVAREKIYQKLSRRELSLISQHLGIRAKGTPLARLLAEAGPRTPLNVGTVKLTKH